MKVLEIVKKNWKWILLVFSIILFLIFVENVLDKEIEWFDTAGYNLIKTYLISDSITPVAKFITHLGGATCLITITVILLIVIKNKKIGLGITLNLIIATILNIVLKNILQRTRPIEHRIIDDTGFSFPSGHSMVSMAFYGFLVYLIYKYIKNKYVKYSLIIALSSLIVIIGASRIYLGVHYTSDVLAGFLVSIAYLIIYTHYFGILVVNNKR